MPAATIFEIIELGNFADIDPIEGDMSSSTGVDVRENESALLNQVFGSAGDPLDDHRDQWTSSNPLGSFSNPIYNSNDNFQGIRPPGGPFSPNGDQSFTIGTGGSSGVRIFDSWVNVSANITYTDGSTVSTPNNVFLVQDQAGDLYLLPLLASGTATLDVLRAQPIQSIEITSVGGLLGGISFRGDSFGFVCFARGTRIETVMGQVPVEELAAGDLVRTLDHGMQPIRWIGSATCPALGDMAPVVIRKGTLDNTRDLRVSPQHRMLLSGWRAELLYGEHEVLAAAKSLINDNTIRQVEGGTVEYFHILFDTHEIIYSEGAPSESFHPGEEGWSALDPAMQEEIQALFPKIREDGFASYGQSARKSLKPFEGALWSMDA